MRDETPGMLGTCFVVMGFGKKTDFETGRTLDLDKTYKNIIKPAAEAARLMCGRADEIVHSGMIDLPMYEQLLTADVVIADLSTSNKNTLYELGVRHALRPYTTIVIAEDGIKVFPFDINHVVVRQYHHTGEDIGYDEVMRFRQELIAAITKILATEPPQSDSPIYTILKNLAPPLRGEEKNEATTRAMKGGEADKSREFVPPAPEIVDPPAIEPGPPQSGSGSSDMPAPAPDPNVANTRAEAIADFVEAERIRKEVLTICEPLLGHEYLSDANKYWVRATMAEAYVGLGDEQKARQKLEEADSFSPSEWMKETTNKRLVALRSYLDQSSLKFVNTEN